MTLTEYRDDELLEFEIHSRRVEIVLPQEERRGTHTIFDGESTTDIIVRPGDLGGIRHAVAPIPEWIFWTGLVLAGCLLLVVALALAWCIAMGLDWAFWHLGQWSAS